METTAAANNTFGDLPQALVNELLGECQAVGKELYTSFKEIQEQKHQLRKQLEDKKMLAYEANYNIPTPPTTCAVDGAFVKEELMSVDLLACAAVALEGITPPSESRHWEDPKYYQEILPERHHPDSGTILRAVMIGMEMTLAEKAPHDVVFLDGSFTTPLIFMNQAINKASEGDNSTLKISGILHKRLPAAIDAYKKILENGRTDKVWIAMPKYTTHKEIGRALGWKETYDDKALLTLLLNPGEFTKPITLEQSGEWHLTYASKQTEIEAIKNGLKRLKVMYYKPHMWTPALRIELSAGAATNDYQIASILQAVKFQCATSGIFEPYPLFLADRMAKSLGTAIPAFRQVVTRQMAEDFDGDIGEVYIAMHGYRTEKHK